MKDDAGAGYWGSAHERAERWADRTMRAESLKVVYPVVDDGLDYAPSLKDLPVHERVFGRPPIALPDKDRAGEAIPTPIGNRRAHTRPRWAICTFTHTGARGSSDRPAA